MKITASRKALAAALKTATVPAATGALPVLTGLHLEARGGTLTVTGTNLDLTVATDVEAQTDGAGAAVLPGKLLADLVGQASSDTVTIDVDGEEATIVAGSARAELKTLRIEDWPQVTTADGKRHELPAPDVERLAMVLHAVSTDQSRQALLGVHFSGNQVRATDSYRLAISTLGTADMPDRIVPADVVSRVAKASPNGLTVRFDDRQVTFDNEAESTSWTSRLIADAYPPVERLVRESSPFQLRVPRLRLIDALLWVRTLAEGQGRAISVIRDGDMLRLASRIEDKGKADNEVPCTGDWDQPLRCNSGYLSDLLNTVEDDEVVFELDAPGKPLQVRTSDWRTVLILMPIVDKQAA